MFNNSPDNSLLLECNAIRGLVFKNPKRVTVPREVPPVGNIFSDGLETARIRIMYIILHSMDSPSTPRQPVMESYFNSFGPDYMAYALSQLDPFHDTNFVLKGAPSDQNGNSIVIIENKEITLSAAQFGLPVTSGAKFDMHITALPVTSSFRGYRSFLEDKGAITAGPSTGSESAYDLLFPFSVSASVSGAPTFMLNDVGAGNTILGVDTELADYLPSISGPRTQRSMRVIGQSFEVVDESPKIYQQGAVTVYSRNSSLMDSEWFRTSYTLNGNTANTANKGMLQTINGPPNHIEHATIIPNSRTWKASNGAYVINRTTEGPPPFVRPGVSRCTIINPPDVYDATAANSYCSREFVNSLGGYNINDFQACTSFQPYNVCGAYFTGLSSEFGNYRLRTKFMVEIIPDPEDSALISLSSPTLPKNSEFELVLSNLLRELPIGVMQTANPKGEWWRTVKSLFGKALVGVSPVIATSGPLGAAVAPAVHYAGTQIENSSHK